MEKFIVSLLWRLLDALYEDFGAALVTAILFMFLYMAVKKAGIKNVARQWIDKFKHDKSFRRIFFLTFFSAFILFRTVFCRNVSGWPLQHIRGTWGLYNSDGRVNVEGAANVVLFIPLTMLVYWALSDKIFGRFKKSFINILWISTVISFCISLGIELCQLFLKVGQFQLSDIAFNTLGGIIGGVLYYIIHKIKKHSTGKNTHAE